MLTCGEVDVKQICFRTRVYNIYYFLSRKVSGAQQVICLKAQRESAAKLIIEIMYVMPVTSREFQSQK